MIDLLIFDSSITVYPEEHRNVLHIAFGPIGLEEFRYGCYLGTWDFTPYLMAYMKRIFCAVRGNKDVACVNYNRPKV